MNLRSQPWRKVEKAEGPRVGRGSVLGPDTDRRTAWWVLHLECGHRVERTVRYKPDPEWPHPGKGNSRWRPKHPDHYKPAPRQVRCDYCPEHTP